MLFRLLWRCEEDFGNAFRTFTDLLTETNIAPPPDLCGRDGLDADKMQVMLRALALRAASCREDSMIVFSKAEPHGYLYWVSPDLHTWLWHQVWTWMAGTSDDKHHRDRYVYAIVLSQQEPRMIFVCDEYANYEHIGRKELTRLQCAHLLV